MEAFKRNLQPLFDRLDHVELGRVAEKLEVRANTLCLTFRASHTDKRRSFTGERVRMLRQRAAVLRKWQKKALAGEPLPLNWKSELAEAEALDE
jgi:hypothetical protein